MGKLNRSLVAAATVASGAFAASAGAQLAPERTYYGTNRPFPIVVTSPGTENPLSIKLMDPANAVLETKEAVAPGKVDLSSLFPSLWETQGQRGVLYAQLFEGDTPVGPAVVIQPMLAPAYASMPDRRAGRPDGKPEWAPSAGIFSGYRAYIDKDILMATSEGDITFRMRPDEAPNTVWNFLSLGDGGFYTDIAFHRVMPQFVIQAGDPRGEGTGGPGYFLDLEDSKLLHDFGVLSMARSSDPNSNGSQVFICLSRERTQGLDTRYTGFGQAITGADVIMKIANTPLTSERRSETPVNPPLIHTATLVDAAPRGTGAAPVALPKEEAPSGR